ncbi:MAG: gluconate:H+ symporter [Leadbetterella sp.]
MHPVCLGFVSTQTHSLIILVASILVLVLLVSYIKIDTFIAFILVSIGMAYSFKYMGIKPELTAESIMKSIKTGIGSILGNLAMIVGFGAVLGKIAADSGATRVITDKILAFFGQKYLTWGLALAGFLIGIPLFYNAGFIIVIPLIFSIGLQTRLPLIYLAIPMLSALSVAHGYLPPHPSPAALAATMNADISDTLLYGIIIAIPAIIVAGPLFGKTLKKIHSSALENYKEEKTKSDLPSTFESFFVALLPVFMLIVFPLIRKYTAPNKGSVLADILDFLCEANVVMLVSVLVAAYVLIIKKNKSIQDVNNSVADSFKSISSIFMVMAGSGALMQILVDTGVGQTIGEMFGKSTINPLFTAWLMAAFLRVCIGSATVAGTTAASLILPLANLHPEISRELLVLAVGSGSLMFSHVNDPGFWLYKEYFKLSIKDTILSWSIMETIVSIMGIIGVLFLSTII